nr:transglutaminase-like domain-containing protein [Sphingomonas sp. H160509]
MEDGEIELDLAALELAALDHPGIDRDEYLDELTDMEIALRAADGDAVSSAAQAQALSSVMVEEFGFSGDRTHYDDPQNADLIAVVDRRLGLPISLSIPLCGDGTTSRMVGNAAQYPPVTSWCALATRRMR